MRRTKQPFMVTVPSLVQHNDFVPSVKGGRQHTSGRRRGGRRCCWREDGLAVRVVIHVIADRAVA